MSFQTLEALAQWSTWRLRGRSHTLKGCVSARSRTQQAESL
jgi:hypothetical protein